MQKNSTQTLGYKSIIETQTRQVFDASISTKIFQHINRVRDASHEGQARRWIWELIQNAKDAAYRDTPAHIRVVYTGDTLAFSHTGRPFGIKNVLSIINQVSSKAPDDEETTGKFGTGFITTHLLSERVQLDGIIQDKILTDGQETLLPYKPFTVLLDRSGNSQDEILEAVNVAVNVISNLDSSPDITPEVGGFHTTFTYFLTTPASQRIAQIGMEDLAHSIVYALAFTSGVAEITLENRVAGTLCRYGSDGAQQGDGISLFHATETADGGCHHHTLLLARQGDTILATPVASGHFLAINSLTPRLFADFPLIGSEAFPFPVVCNNRRFLPDELRSGLPLSANQNSVNSVNNKGILLDALSLYQDLVRHAVAEDYRDFYHIASLSDLPQRTDLDVDWAKEYLYGHVLSFLYTQPIVQTAQGMGAPSYPVYFPHAPQQEERTAIGGALALCQQLVPTEEEQGGWYQAFCGQAVTGQKIAEHLKSGERLLLEAQAPKEQLGDAYLPYLQCIYDIAMDNPTLRPRIEGGELAIFPDQTPNMTLHTASDIYLDPGLDAPIKAAIHQLDMAVNVGNLRPKKIYQSLLHTAFQLRDLTTVHPISVDGLFSYIEGKLEYTAHRLSHNLPLLYKAAVLLASCYESPYWLQLAHTVYPDDTLDLPHCPSKLSGGAGWRNAIILLINLADRRLGLYNSVSGIQSAYLSHKSEEEVYQWLSKFYAKAFPFTTYLSRSTIFPNQRGQLKSLQNLYLDEGMDETLKDVLEGIAQDPFFYGTNIRNYRSILLHKGITAFPLSNFSLQTFSNGQIASDITRHITALLNNKSLAEAGDDMQDACTQLLAWIQRNEGAAERMFPSYYTPEDRMKLLTAKAAARMSGELSRVNSLLSQYGVSDLAEVLAAHYAQQSDDTPYHHFEDDEVYIDHDQMEGWSRAQQMEFARRVGLYGEEQAFRYLREKWESEGYQVSTQTDWEIVLIHPESQATVTLSRPDRGNYCQPGWDISETLTVGDATSPTHYYEVKSTVAQQRRKLVRLSCTQANFAMQQGANYSVLSLFLPKTLQGVLDVTLLTDVFHQLQQGVLTMTQDTLWLQHRV